MGSKLPVLAAAIIAAVAVAAATAAADTEAELLKRGIDLYKAGKFAEAVPVLAKAYELAPKPDTLFPLAQAERLAGDCTSAAAHYKKLLTELSDLNVAKLVQQSLALCEKPTDSAPTTPACAEAPTAPSDAAKPVTVTKTVVRDGGGDRLAIASAVVGTLALGASAGLAVAAQSSLDASNKAVNLDAHNSFATRTTQQRDEAIAAGAVGAVALGYAVYRWVTHHEKRAADVAVAPAPSPGGGTVWVTGRF